VKKFLAKLVVKGKGKLVQMRCILSVALLGFQSFVIFGFHFFAVVYRVRDFIVHANGISLCNIYAPNDLVNQLQFMQELNNCIIDKSELTSLIVGGDWNCALSKKDKIGGAPWKPSSYRNLMVTTMEIFDLVDIQRMRHPKLLKFTYESKSLKLKSRIDFLLIAKTLRGCKINRKFTMQSRLTITQFTFRYLGPKNLLGDQDSGNLTTLC